MPKVTTGKTGDRDSNDQWSEDDLAALAEFKKLGEKEKLALMAKAEEENDKKKKEQDAESVSSEDSGEFSSDDADTPKLVPDAEDEPDTPAATVKDDEKDEKEKKSKKDKKKKDEKGENERPKYVLATLDSAPPTPGKAKPSSADVHCVNFTFLRTFLLALSKFFLL